MTSTTNQDICQFSPSAARGDAALNLSACGGQAIAVQISPNQATALNAGDVVKFDSTQTMPGLPWVIAAADNETGVGVLKKDLKQSIFAAGAVADMQTNIGPISVQVAAATCVPGNILETSSGGVQPKSAGAAKFLGIDYGTTGMTIRCAILPPSMS